MDADSEEQGPPFRYFAIESLDYKKNFLLVDNHSKLPLFGIFMVFARTLLR